MQNCAHRFGALNLCPVDLELCTWETIFRLLKLQCLIGKALDTGS